MSSPWASRRSAGRSLVGRSVARRSIDGHSVARHGVARHGVARHGVAVLVLGGVLLAGQVDPLGRTSATFTGSASTAGVLSTGPACVGDTASYTSGLLDAAAPLLRWSFSGPAAPGGPGGSATTGLLVCDPVDLAAGGDAGPTAARSWDLAGGVGGGITSGPVVPTGPVTLLMWLQAGVGDGELASLSVASTAVVDVGAPASGAAPATDTAPTAPVADGPPAVEVPWDALVLGLAGGTVQLTNVLGGTATVLASAAVTPGVTHLVAAEVGVTGDGTPSVTLAVDDSPATEPVPLHGTVTGASLTVGARASTSAAVARVDEVTLLAGRITAPTRAALLAADRWWPAEAAGRAGVRAAAGAQAVPPGRASP